LTSRFKLSAVVLRTVDYGEADRVVTLLSRERGKLVAFARGARASKRRFGGGLEPFTQVTAELAARGGGDAMARLDSVSVERSFHHVRGDLARIGCAAYAAELAGALVRDHEPHAALFDLLVEYLGRLDAAPARPAELRIFELGALEGSGFQPRLDGCARCGEAAGVGAAGAAFSPVDGGLLCERCQADAVGTTRLSAEAVAALRRFQQGGFGAAGEGMSPAVGRELREALGRFVEQLLGHRLQARRFLDEVASFLSE
jgi:DNA repair protein RecO (recombination protein O)